MRKIRPEELTQNVFGLIGDTWMLVSAARDGVANTMTASWGGLGVLFGKKVAFLFIRPQRYTKEFIDASETLSLTFLNDSWKKELSYIGSVSGRQEDKIANTGLELLWKDGTPYFAQGKLILFCRKLYAQEMDSKCFLDSDILKRWYANHDFHTAYVVEIEQAFMSE